MSIDKNIEEEINVSEKQPDVVNEELNKEEVVCDEASTETFVPEEDTTLDIVLENSKLENYEIILEKFTDILTLTENRILEPVEDTEQIKNIITLGLDVFTIGANFCKSGSDEDLYKFIAKNFEYLGMYLFTFSAEETPVGILTNKIDNLLYDFIGNQEDLLQQFNVFQANFKGNRDNDLKSLISPLMFNLSNIGTNIACIKSIIHYIKLQEEKSVDVILEDIILHIEK